MILFPRRNDAFLGPGNKDILAKLNDEELVGYDFIKETKEVSRKEYVKPLLRNNTYF
jgi:hypothetical protein